MPTICRPPPAYFLFRSCSLGNDFLHGSQNVPQKSTSTTLPRSDFSETEPLPPTMVFTLKSGAGLPTRPPFESAESAPLPSSAAPQPPRPRERTVIGMESQMDAFLMGQLLSRPPSLL